MRLAGPDEPLAELHPAAMVSSDNILERIVRAIGESGRYRVVARFRRRTRYFEDDGTPTRTALYVDVETTGVDATHDSIIQLCAVPFRYVPSDGRIVEVQQGLTYLEDPGQPIPGLVTALTGITTRR